MQLVKLEIALLHVIVERNINNNFNHLIHCSQFISFFLVFSDILEVQNKDNGLRDSRTNLTSDEEQLDNNESDSNPSTNNKYLSVMTMHVRNGATGGVGGLNSGQISKTASTTLLDQIPENTALTSRRPSVVLQEILSTRRPSTIMAALRRPSLLLPGRRMESFPENGSTRSINMPHTGAKSEQALEQRRKNRRVGE